MISKIKTIIRGIIGIFESIEKAPTLDLKPQVLTKTTSGREVEYYNIGNGKTNVLFIGCIHGNEIGTSKLVLNLANYLKKNISVGFTFYFVPVLNFDGYAKASKKADYFGGGRVGRTNDNNVDLNRNFDTKDWISEGVWEFGSQKIKVSGGEKPFSEPETRALKDFVEANKIEVIFDFHNRAGTVLATLDKLGQEIADIYSKESGYKDISRNTYQNTGWIKNYFENKGITYIEIETTKRWGSDWERNRGALIKILKIL